MLSHDRSASFVGYRANESFLTSISFLLFRSLVPRLFSSDSVAASTFQMQEVFNGYRQSGDAASKRRVRESINAALGNLPDWPLQSY